jgi:hypothetical protein
VDEDFEAALDNWQQGRHEKLSRSCTTIISVRWIVAKIGNYATYDGTTDLCSFLVDMEEKFVVDQRVLTLDITLRPSPSIWWTNHKGNMSYLDKVKLSIQYHLIPSSQVNQLSKDQKIKS